MLHKAVFIIRDVVITRSEILPATLVALQLLQSLDYKLIVVSKHSDIINNMNLSESWMIAISMPEIEAAEDAGITNLIKIDNGEEIIGYTGKYPLTISGSLYEAARVIMRR